MQPRSAFGRVREGLSRRGLLRAAAAAPGLAALAGFGAGAAGPPAAAEAPFALRRLAQSRGFRYGCAVEPESLERDPAFADLVRRQCAGLTPENAMKWNALRPARGVFDFSRADKLMTLALAQGASVHGHCLLWHEANPDWLTGPLAAFEARDLIRDHIRAVVGRYAGQVGSWDVVNEAVERNDHRQDGLRRSIWLEALGPDYLEIAFRAAHTADPVARLALADYGLEYDDEPWMVEKRGTMLAVLERLRSRAVPIHALSIQGHLDGARSPAFGDGLARFLARVAALGLDIYVTELDVNDQKVPGDEAARDMVVAETYREFLSVVCDQPAVRMINTWGLTDRYTSKATMFPRQDGAEVRPLPFDRALAPKAAALAMADVFSRPGRRHD